MPIREASVVYTLESSSLAYEGRQLLTPLLHPLDVGLFLPLQYNYGRKVDQFFRTGGNGIRKANFLSLNIKERK